MMKQLFLLVLLILIGMTSFSQVDKILGSWKTVDDKTGEIRSLVRIYKATDGKYYGKIEKLFVAPDSKCVNCEGKDKDQPVVGMVIIRAMEDKKGSLENGSVLDPETGKFYYGTITYDAKTDKLKLRGSLDKLGLLGRSQFWIREK
jgi:uncharacterized protein (DUF2147 family)